MMDAILPYPDIAEQIREIGAVIEVPRTTQLYRTLHPATPPASIQITRDIHYGPHERHVLDVFQQRDSGTATPRPIVMFVHGGGFRLGAKQLPDQPFYDNVGIWAARAGLVGVTLSYRLAPEFTYPSGIEDMERAVTQVAALATDCGGDPQRIYMWGHSAGAAHIADYIVSRDNPRLAGAILLSGIYDKGSGTPDSPWSVYYGSDASRYAAMSSLPGLARTNLPLLVCWGELDRPDFISDGTTLVAARSAAGKPTTALELATHSHISEICAVGTADTSLTDAVLAFIGKTSGRPS